jgi:hypothetical protein
MDGSSVHVPVIAGVGLGVREGGIVSVGITVFVGDGILWVAVGVDSATVALLHELCAKRKTMVITMVKDREK